MFTQQQLRFLSYGKCEDIARTNLQHIGARKGRAFQTNGHVAYLVDIAAEALGEGYQPVDESGKVLDAPKPPTIDEVIKASTKGKPIRLPLETGIADALRHMCATAQGVNKALEREWRKLSKKERTGAPSSCGVALKGNGYGLNLRIAVRGKPTISMRATDAPCPKFKICLDPDYLLDALNAFADLRIGAFDLQVTGENDPALFVAGIYTALVMPRAYERRR